MARRPRPKEAAAVVLLGVAVVVAVLVTIGLVHRSDELPTRAAFERTLAVEIASSRAGPISVDCDQPRRDAVWYCSVRDGTGSRGWAEGFMQTVTVRNGARAGDSTTQRAVHEWGFPIAADGSVEDTVQLSATVGVDPRAVTLAAQQTVRRVQRAVGGKDAGIESLSMSCPAVPLAGTATCTGLPPITTMTVTRTDANDYRFDYRVPVGP